MMKPFITTNRRSLYASFIVLLAIFQWKVAGAELNVPEQFSSIQSALDVANCGDTVMVEPGIYRESLKMTDKSVVLTSRFIHTGDIADIHHTVLDGTNADGETRKQTVIFVPKTIGEWNAKGVIPGTQKGSFRNYCN